MMDGMDAFAHRTDRTAAVASLPSRIRRCELHSCMIMGQYFLRPDISIAEPPPPRRLGVLWLGESRNSVLGILVLEKPTLRRRKGKTGGARGGTKTEPQERRSQRATEHARSTMGKDLDLAWGWATWRRPGGGGRARAREASAASLEGVSEAGKGGWLVGRDWRREPLGLHSADRNRIARRPQHRERERKRERERRRARGLAGLAPRFRRLLAILIAIKAVVRRSDILVPSP